MPLAFDEVPMHGAVATTGDRACTPVRAIDTHAHVFQRALPMPDLRRAPSGYDATVSDYLARLDQYGISHGVLVQPSFLGTDNTQMLSALKAHPSRLRGVVVIDPDSTADDLRALDQAGAVGIRLNLIGMPIPDYSTTPWRALLRHIRDLGWLVEVHQAAHHLAPTLEPLLNADVRVVVDHFGRPDPARGIQDPGFDYLLTLGCTRQVWVKLSAAYRNGPGSRGNAIAQEALPLLRERFGLDQLLWGSDWPHTRFESSANYGQTRDALDRWLPSAADREIVLRDAAAQLYRFPLASAQSFPL